MLWLLKSFLQQVGYGYPTPSAGAGMNLLPGAGWGGVGGTLVEAAHPAAPLTQHCRGHQQVPNCCPLVVWRGRASC